MQSHSESPQPLVARVFMHTKAVVCCGLFRGLTGTVPETKPILVKGWWSWFQGHGLIAQCASQQPIDNWYCTVASELPCNSDVASQT